MVEFVNDSGPEPARPQALDERGSTVPANDRARPSAGNAPL